jgi:hypothetical protein
MAHCCEKQAYKSYGLVIFSRRKRRWLGEAEMETVSLNRALLRGIAASAVKHSRDAPASGNTATGASLEIKKQLCPWSGKVTFGHF